MFNLYNTDQNITYSMYYLDSLYANYNRLPQAIFETKIALYNYLAQTIQNIADDLEINYILRIKLIMRFGGVLLGVKFGLDVDYGLLNIDLDENKILYNNLQYFINSVDYDDVLYEEDFLYFAQMSRQLNLPYLAELCFENGVRIEQPPVQIVKEIEDLHDWAQSCPQDLDLLSRLWCEYKAKINHGNFTVKLDANGNTFMHLLFKNESEAIVVAAFEQILALDADNFLRNSYVQRNAAGENLSNILDGKATSWSLAAKLYYLKVADLVCKFASKNTKQITLQFKSFKQFFEHNDCKYIENLLIENSEQNMQRLLNVMHNRYQVFVDHKQKSNTTKHFTYFLQHGLFDQYQDRTIAEHLILYMSANHEFAAKNIDLCHPLINVLSVNKKSLLTYMIGHDCYKIFQYFCHKLSGKFSDEIISSAIQYAILLDFPGAKFLQLLLGQPNSTSNNKVNQSVVHIEYVNDAMFKCEAVDNIVALLAFYGFANIVFNDQQSLLHKTILAISENRIDFERAYNLIRVMLSNAATKQSILNHVDKNGKTPIQYLQLLKPENEKSSLNLRHLYRLILGVAPKPHEMIPDQYGRSKLMQIFMQRDSSSRELIAKLKDLEEIILETDQMGRDIWHYWAEYQAHDTELLQTLWNKFSACAFSNTPGKQKTLFILRDDIELTKTSFLHTLIRCNKPDVLKKTLGALFSLQDGLIAFASLLVADADGVRVSDLLEREPQLWGEVSSLVYLKAYKSAYLLSIAKPEILLNTISNKQFFSSQILLDCVAAKNYELLLIIIEGRARFMHEIITHQNSIPANYHKQLNSSDSSAILSFFESDEADLHVDGKPILELIDEYLETSSVSDKSKNLAKSYNNIILSANLNQRTSRLVFKSS